jgi:hypothetical protein
VLRLLFLVILNGKSSPSEEAAQLLIFLKKTGSSCIQNMESIRRS